MTADSRHVMMCRTSTVYGYDLDSGQDVARFFVIPGTKFAVSAVSTYGEQMLIVASATQVGVYVFDGSGWVIAQTQSGFSDIASIAASPNGRWLSVTDIGSDTLKVFNLQTLSTVPLSTRNVIDARAQAYSPNSGILYVGDDLGQITPVSTTTWNLGSHFSVADDVRSLLVSPTGTHIWVGLTNQLQRRLVSGTFELGVPLSSAPTYVGRDALGRVHCNGSAARSVYVRPDDSVDYVPGHYRDINALAVALSGTQLATGGSTGEPILRVWNPNGSERWWLDPDGTPIEAVAYAPTSLSLAVATSAGASGKVKIFNTSGVQTNPTPITQANVPKAIAYSTSLPTHGPVVAFGNGIVTRLYRVNTNTFLNDLGNHSGAITAIAFSRDGSRIATGGADGIVNVFKVDTTATWGLVTSYAMGGSILELTFDSTGTFLYAASTTATNGLRSLIKAGGGTESWNEHRVFDADTVVGNVRDLALSRDGRVIVVTGDAATTFLLAGSFAPMLTWLVDAQFTEIEFSATNHDLYAVRDRTLYSLRNPYPTFVSTLSVSPTSVNKGQSATMTVNLTKSAPAGGVTVLLYDYTTSVLTPANVFIPAGQYSGTAQLKTVAASKAGTYTITAKLFGSAVNTQLTINP
jgi:WD40 repeat protein